MLPHILSEPTLTLLVFTYMNLVLNMVDEGMLSAFWCHKPWPSLIFINKLQIVEPGWNVSKSYKLASVDTTSALPMNCSMAASCFSLPAISWWYWTEARFHLMQYALHSSAPKQFWEIQWVGTSIPNHLAIKETSQTQFKSLFLLLFRKQQHNKCTFGT